MRAPPAAAALLLVLGACTSRASAPSAGRDATLEPTAASARPPATAASAPSAPTAATNAGAPEKRAAHTGNPSKPGKYDVSVPAPSSELAEFLRTHVPTGGSVTTDDPPKVMHTVTAGQSVSSIAATYLPISELYTANELANAISKKNPSGAIVGKKLEIPAVVTRVLRDDPKEERLGWPE